MSCPVVDKYQVQVHTHDVLRKSFEAFWLETRGFKKAQRELRPDLRQPDVYWSDSANRHWITWQAAVGYVVKQGIGVSS